MWKSQSRGWLARPRAAATLAVQVRPAARGPRIEEHWSLASEGPWLLPWRLPLRGAAGVPAAPLPCLVPLPELAQPLSLQRPDRGDQGYSHRGCGRLSPLCSPNKLRFWLVSQGQPKMASVHPQTRGGSFGDGPFLPHAHFDRNRAKQMTHCFCFSLTGKPCHLLLSPIPSTLSLSALLF